MNAKEARELSEAGEQLQHVKRKISEACLQGDFRTECRLTGQTVRNLLREGGFDLEDVVDDDGDYRATILKW